MRNNMNYVFKRVLAFFTIFFILSCLKSCHVHAEEINYDDNVDYSIRANSTMQDGYRDLINNNGITDNFAFGRGLYFQFRNNLVNLNPIQNTSGNYSFITAFTVCQTGTNYSLNYDAGGVHSNIKTVSTLGYSSNGSCSVNVYTGKIVTYYILVSGIKQMNENCLSNYCLINNSFVMRFPDDIYVESRALSVKYFDYTDELANSLNSLSSQNAINDKLQQELNQNNTIINQNTEINNSINETNTTLNDDSVDDPSSKFSEFEGKLSENGVITQLITLPVTLYSRILNTVNGTCNQFNLGNLLGTDLILPCINISDYLGSNLWNIIDILFSGFFVFAISKKMIKVFENMSSMRESDDLSD